jgi:hypothetical protein
VVVLGGGGWYGIGAQSVDDGRHIVTMPLTTIGLADGEGLRTTMTNRGTREVVAAVLISDSDGVVVKRDTLVLAPGASRVSAATVDQLRTGTAETRGTVVKVELVLPRSATDTTLIQVDVFDLVTAAVSTRTRGGCTGPSFLCGSNGNHNETLLIRGPRP